MKPFFQGLLLLILTLPVQAQHDIVVDPNASLRTLNGQFSSIKISGSIDLFLSQSDNSALAVSAAGDDFKAGIKTEVKDSVLHIYYDGNTGWKKKDRKLRVYVSFASLKKIEASGACNILVTDSLSAETLEILLSGVCDFKGKLNINTLKFDLSGASDIKVSGTANTVIIENSGASDVKGFELVTDICKVNASGASDVQITVNKALTVDASGVSKIKYKGTAVVTDLHSSGVSKISKVN